MQTDALRALREKVAAGENPPVHVIVDAFPGQLNGKWFIDGCYGSLDAAHALHKAVLGKRWAFVLHDGACRLDPLMPSIDSSITCFNADPARAWLLAIIDAKIAEAEAAP